MIVRIATRLSARPERVWQEVQTPRLLIHVAFPLLTFRSREPGGFPATWADGPHRVRMRLLGLVPLGAQTIEMSRGRTAAGGYWIRDAGHGSLVRLWDHLITIDPAGEGRTEYVDRVDVRAGPLTPLVVVFAQAFYRWRQHRWRRLAEGGFNWPDQGP